MELPIHDPTLTHIIDINNNDNNIKTHTNTHLIPLLAIIAPCSHVEFDQNVLLLLLLLLLLMYINFCIHLC